MRENQFSTWFSHDEYVGVKCMRTLYSPITSAALVSKSGSLDTMCRSSLCHLPRQLQSELTPVSPPPPCPCAGSPTPPPPHPPPPPALSLRRLANSDHAMPASASRPIPSAPQSHHLRDGSCGAVSGTGASVAAATAACTAAIGSVTEASSAAMGLSAAWPGISVDSASGAPGAAPCTAPLSATAPQASENGAPPCARNTSVRGVAPTAMVGGVAPSTLTGPEVRSRRRECTAPSSASTGERASPLACARRYTTVSSSGASPGPLGSGFVRRCWCRNA